MAVVGVIPAAGYATRLQPIASSKEVYPIHGRPVIDYLVERMRAGGCSELRVVTRPDKRDVIEYARRHRATVIAARPPSPAASIAAGVDGLGADDVVLFGFPDSIWEPVDGFRAVLRLLMRGADAALGLFRTSEVIRPDVVTVGESAAVTAIDVSTELPPPHLIWGCAAANARALAGLAEEDDPGVYLDLLCRRGHVAGTLLSDSYLDMGTRAGLRRALATSSPR